MGGSNAHSLSDYAADCVKAANVIASTNANEASFRPDKETQGNPSLIRSDDTGRACKGTVVCSCIGKDGSSRSNTVKAHPFQRLWNGQFVLPTSRGSDWLQRHFDRPKKEIQW